MRNLSRVVWSEGMHLSVHHFQAQNRYFEESIQFATSSLWTAPYGLMNCELSPDAIQNGKVSLLSASGVLRDGLVFSIPDPDILPEKDSELDVAPLMHATEHSLLVFLCTPKYKSDGGNCALETADGDVRYRAQTLRWHDENTGRDEKELQLGHKNLKLYAGKLPAGHEGIPIARVLRVGGAFGYDPTFIPPSLHISGSKALKTLPSSSFRGSRRRERFLTFTARVQRRAVPDFLEAKFLASGS